MYLCIIKLNFESIKGLSNESTLKNLAEILKGKFSKLPLGTMSVNYADCRYRGEIIFVKIVHIVSESHLRSRLSLNELYMQTKLSRAEVMV